MSTNNQSVVLTEEIEYDEDPRWVWDLPLEMVYASWPCGQCGVRRDEHADQEVQSSLPQLDITDHVFVEKFTPVTYIKEA